MRIRRTLPIALAVVSIAAAVTLTVQLRKHAPPEPARLLPGADGFLYANFNWIRKANNGKPFFPVSHDPGYEHFIQETGFDYERDLEAVAFAVHYPEKWPGGGTGGAAPEARFSEVLVGHFDGDKCLAYLKRTAQSVENYHSVDIFTIPISGRTFRIAMLGVDIVGASNHDDPAVIRGMVDRSRRLASPFGGPALLRKYYKRVQLASPVWLVARIVPTAPEFDGWSHVFAKPADLVVSASYNPLHLPLRTGALHLRAEAWAANGEDAHEIADKLNVFLAMFHSAEASVGSPGTDQEVKAAFDSLQVRQEDSRAEVYATLSTGFFRKLVDSTDQLPGIAPGAQSAAQPAPKQ
ncbi:MAG TPA: hypothetical protein VHW45_15050 [Candidatus Sulfotelmatobacter sp.]|nr:hypothetical protein [Candidatus Sulfotelmatobacter sp.]